MTFTPLGWQIKAKTALDAADWTKGQIVVAATGSGKTAGALSWMMDDIRAGKRVLWVGHRAELVSQPLATLNRFWPGIDAGIVKADRNEAGKQVVFASRDSIRQPARLADYLRSGQPAWVVVDEAHHSGAASYAFLGAFSRSTRLLGLTATPGRQDSKRLSARWSICFSYGILDAVKDGVLVAPYAANVRIPELRLDELEVTRGDYDPQALEAELVRAHVVEHTVEAVLREHTAVRLPFRDEEVVVHPATKSILVFTVTVRQAQLTATALTTAGIPAEAVHGEMKPKDRAMALERFGTGELRALCSADALTEGTDLPIAKVVVMASPTRSHTKYVQQAGRGLRKHGSEERALILDLVGATREYSLVGAPVLVDGVDCPVSQDGLHRYLPLESGEGRCQDCGHMIKCYARGGTHLFKDGRCRVCGATQCPRSPTKQHAFIPWEDHKRACIHCAMEIPDPLSSMIARPYARKEPVAWQRLPVQGTVYATSAGKESVLYNIRDRFGRWKPYLHTRGKLHALSPTPVEAELARMLTDDVARQTTPRHGQYGALRNLAMTKIFMAKAIYYAKTHRLWEVP